jgi:hypothetical protein
MARRKDCGLTAAMPDGTGICDALERFPERSFDVGSPSSLRDFRRRAIDRRIEAGLRDLLDVPATGLRSTRP